MIVSMRADGEQISTDAIDAWERKRSAKVGFILQRRLGIPRSDITRDGNGPRNISDIRAELTQLKLRFSPDMMRSDWARSTKLSGRVTKIANFLYRGHRRSSIVEMTTEGCPAEELLARYFRLMLQGGSRNREICLSANPDHYILEPRDGRVQEVLETTGGARFPSHFLIHYGVESGLLSEKDPAFPFQAAGLCCLTDGTVVGGVRHQLRDVANQVEVRLEVEFPRALPNFMIRQHQLHLACEFRNWFDFILLEPLI